MNRSEQRGFDLSIDLPMPWEDERRSQPIVLG
jgi:hypothetical protein